MRVLMRFVGRDRLDRTLRPVQRVLKRTFFDCKMCGQCALSSTGMACPTNCAKNMRNGPCGGVRANGNCEVVPSMRCVWVEATAGRKRLSAARIPSATSLAAMDHRLIGSSSWARVIACDPGPERLVAGNKFGEPAKLDTVSRENLRLRQLVALTVLW
jgi:hypothetical protein